MTTRTDIPLVALLPVRDSATICVPRVAALPRAFRHHPEIRVVSPTPDRSGVHVSRGATDRVTAALRHLAQDLPDSRLAALIDQGLEVRLNDLAYHDQSGADLAVCIAALVYAGVIARDAVAGLGFIGQLTPLGGIHSVEQIPDAVRVAYHRGLAGVVVPSERSATVALVLEACPVSTYAADSLDGLVDALRSQRLPPVVTPWIAQEAPVVDDPWGDEASFADVAPDHPIRAALELAAAGRLGMVIHGVGDGSGLSHATDIRIATLLAAALPALTAVERADLTCIATRGQPSVASRKLWRRPVRCVSRDDVLPRHVGLAGHGVLRMVDLGARPITEVNQVIRQLHELRSKGAALPIVVATVAACACGRHAWQLCNCPATSRDRYQAAARRAVERLQRAGIVDLQIAVTTPLVSEDRRIGASTAHVRERVIAASQARLARLARREFNTTEPVARIARVIADLRGLAQVDDACRAEAQQWRTYP